jgi:hypothetical protein
MFQGTMIDDLISTVERVEQKSRKEQEQMAAPPPVPQTWDYPVRRLEWQKVN